MNNLDFLIQSGKMVLSKSKEVTYMLKIGLVGVGGISGAHIPAWEEMENAELVALCDIRPERMEKYSG